MHNRCWVYFGFTCSVNHQQKYVVTYVSKYCILILKFKVWYASFNSPPPKCNFTSQGPRRISDLVTTFPQALVGRQLPKTVEATDNETIPAGAWACLAQSGALLAVGGTTGTPIGRCNRFFYNYTQAENIKHFSELVHRANAFRTSSCNSSFTIRSGVCASIVFLSRDHFLVCGQ